MQRLSWSIAAALLMTSASSPAEVPPRLATRSAASVEGISRWERSGWQGTRDARDIAGLLGEAHGVRPVLCAIASDGLSGWNGRWNDAPSPPVGPAARARASAMPRGDELTPSEVRMLLDSLSSSDVCVRELSTRILGRFGGALVGDELMTRLTSTGSSPELRAASALGLGMAHIKNTATALLRALRDEVTAVRANAAWALGRLDAGGAVRPLIGLLRDDEVEVRQASAGALGHLDSLSSVPELIRILREDDNASVRRTAAWALGQLEAREAITALSTALDGDRHDEVREMAAWALGELEARGSVPALIRALQRDQSRRVRETAAWALGELEDASAVDALGDAAGNDKDAEVRGTAAWALGQLSPSKAPPGLIRAVNDREDDVRLKAAWALSEIGDADAHGALREAFRRETDAHVRRAQVRALVRGGAASQAELGELLRSMDPEARKAAIRGIAGEGSVDVWPWPWPRPRPFPD